MTRSSEPFRGNASSGFGCFSYVLFSRENTASEGSTGRAVVICDARDNASFS